MKILSMTATFGKLSHETLTLKPGLNVIHAPNEWGKSTWCAFIVAMLYGIDTRERSTQTALADKERFAPWSGEAMSGRMDILWNGRSITIERRTKGRSIFGDFRAYETESGLPVSQLTAANCGEMLLGVEKSVFIRSGFLRLADLPVTQDEALRRRLNSLVTTGDESGAGDTLAQRLKDLRNSCRHNKTGLLPQAEAQQKDLTERLDQLHQLQDQIQRLSQRQNALEEQLKNLENHQQALQFTEAQAGAARLDQAQADRNTAAQEVEQLTARCKMLPDREFAALQLQQLRNAQLQQDSLDAETLPPLPQQPNAPDIFAGISPNDALQQTKSDKSAYDMLCKPVSPVLLILTLGCILAGIGLAFIRWYIAIPFAFFAVLFGTMHLRSKSAQTRDRQAILDRYGILDPEQWVPLAQAYAADMAAFTEADTAARAVANALTHRKQELRNALHGLTQGLTPEEAIQKWQGVLSQHKALETARQTLRLAESRVADLSALAKSVPAPDFPDILTLSPEETAKALAAVSADHQQLHRLMGQCQGQMESLGQEESLKQQLSSVQSRIAQLEDIYSALTIAMDTLSAAASELQRRFAPKIASRAQALFGKLTGNRYDRLQLTQELSLHAGAAGEDTLRPSLWRSEGTVDQLYLALRLAVAQELTPNAPLVLDDTFVRFDDTRLAAAMDILKTEAETKQVILFTCQKRETRFV